MSHGSHRRYRGDFALPHTTSSYAPDLPLEPDHLDIFLHPDLEGRAAQVTVTLTTISRTPNANTLTLDGVDFQELTVSDPDASDPKDLSWDYDGDKIHLRWANGAAVDETRRVTLTYRVEEPINGLFFGGPTEATPERGRFMVTDHETERARYWLACVDHPSARVSLDIRVRAPADMEIIATGGLHGEERHDDGTRTAHWHTDARCPSYLTCIIVGDFVRCEDGEFDGKPIAYFALAPYTTEDLQRCFGRTGEMLAFLTRKLGSPLPWEKYYQFAAPGIGGAMENISLVSWDDLWMMDETLHAERGDILDLVNLHEMAHTWFGDLLVIRDFSHAWLKESWATYLESVWLEETQEIDEMHYQLHTERAAYRQEADHSYVRPIVTRRYDSSWRMFDRHLYPGGAIRLHLLRHVLGDAVFWDGVRDYVRDFANKTVETDDFRRALENRSGRYLARFFDQWFRSPGYPHLKANLKHAEGMMTLSVEQTQVDRKKNIDLFSFPLTVAVETADDVWSRHTLDVSERHHALQLAMRKKPRQVVIDPDGVVPHKLTFEPGQSMLKRMLRHGPTIHARIYAAQTLGRSGRRSAIHAIAAAFPEEPFWGVRVVMAKALGESNTSAAARALPELLNGETEPRVQGALTAAAGQFRDAAMAKAIAAWINGGDRPYRATSDALVALGNQRSEEWMPLIEETLAKKSWCGWVERGALRALGEVRSERAAAILTEHLTTGLSPNRRTAANALAGLARELTPPHRRAAAEAISDQLRSDDYGVRLNAIRALGRLGESSAVKAIERARGSITGQDQPTIDRTLRGLRRSGAKSDVGKLREQVERLSNQVRKLEERVATLSSETEAEAG